MTLPVLDGSYYDEAYYSVGPKSNYGLPFTWEVEREACEEIAQYVLSLSPGKVLDVGCAKGFTCRALVEAGIDAYGCDISSWAVDNSEEVVRDRLKVADIREGLPYEDGEFDTVVTYAMLEHVESDRIIGALKELSRVAARRLVIDVPISLTNENEPRGDPSHRSFLPASYYVVSLYTMGWLLDLRKSSQGEVSNCHSVTMLFGRPPLDGVRDARDAD